MPSPSSSKLGLSPGPPPYKDATAKDSPVYRADNSAPLPPPVFVSALKPASTPDNDEDDDDGELGGLGCRPSEDFWLRDGSAVLVCGAVGFRVHASVLCMHAGAFREMLAEPVERQRQQHQRQQAHQSQKSQEIPPPRETFDGCPVLRLPDAPADMRSFLRALYDRSYLADKRAHSLFELGSVLQLATTYRARALRAEVARHAAALFPASRSTYAALATARTQLDMHPLLGVELARRCSLPQLLPAAHLGAARLPLGAVLDGFRLADGRWVRLAPASVREAVAFREALGALVERAVHAPDLACGWHDGEGTAAHAGCAGIARATVRELEARYRRLECALVCGSLLESDAPSLEALRKLCAECKARVWAWEEEVQSRVWAGLPAACGIAGGWDALRAGMVEYT